jgi:hypothetical protein
LLHVPSEPASAQDWQVPAQAVAQQMPCSQKPDAHSEAAPQLLPVGFFVQAPATQTLGAVQSASAVQDVLQRLLPHAYAPHDDVVVVWQVPVPLQVRAGVNVDPVQLAATQVVPLAYSRQVPPPSQVPSVPQLAAPMSAHWPSGSWPAGTSTQVPAVPVIEQDRQLPVQAVRQQAPCSQKPLAHSAVVAQVAPFGFFPQLPPVQTLGATQSASAVQVTRHAPLGPQL